MSKIPYGRQYIDKSDSVIVRNSLKENLITTGKFVKKFEEKLSNFFKVRNAITCNSGTAALHLAFMAADLKKNDVVIMPAVNFISAYNMCSQLGAKIYLADVDKTTGQMTPNLLLDCIRNNKIKKIKLILTMYMGGYPENIFQFYKIKKKFSCLLIEDACHAFGAQYKYKNKFIKVGSCKHSDISTFSLHPLKPITTGEGGLVTTNNNAIALKIRNLRSHGIIKSHKFHWQYNIVQPGYNYRLSDVQCALGISQLKKIEKFIKIREKISIFYQKNFKKLDKFVTNKIPTKDQLSGNHLFIINFKDCKRPLRDKIISKFYDKKIITQVHYIPIYKFNFYKKICKGDFPGAEKYFNSSLSLPIYVSMTLKEIKKVCSTLRSILKVKK